MREIYSPLGVICWLLSQYLRANTLQRVRYKQRCADTSLDPRMLFLLHKLYSDAPSWAHCHTDTLSPRIKNCTHLHAGTQTHPAKQDYPCQSFGRALIWSNGGSESWFVFPSVVRPRSSLPGDTTSCILTPSDTEIHPPTRRPETVVCISSRVPIPYACNGATDNQIIYKSIHFIACSPFLCFWSTAAAAFLSSFFFFNNVNATRTIGSM